VADIIKYLQRRQLFAGFNETVLAVSPCSQSKSTANPDCAYWISYNDLRDSGSLYRYFIFWIYRFYQQHRELMRTYHDLLTNRH